MKHLLLTVSLLLLAAPSFAAEPDVKGVELIRFGIYTLDVASSERDSNGVLQNVVQNPRLALSTTTVPAKIGVTFGIEYKVVGTPDGAQIEMRKVTRFPAPGAKPPGASQALTSNARPVTRVLNQVHFSSYTLEEPWELLTGTWAIELWYEDRKIGEQQFTLVPP